MDMDLTTRVAESITAEPAFAGIGQHRKLAIADQPAILADIYREDVNLAIWRRGLSTVMQSALAVFLRQNPSFQMSIVVSPENARAALQETLNNAECGAWLSEDAAEMVEMFCCLFDLKKVGLRLTALDRAMCPRFHSDRVPCRLVTTYLGAATEWLPHHAVDRTKLGAGNQGLTDDHSGLYKHQEDIQQLSNGDVALLKGESWEGNENAGLVHRSPQVESGQRRLLLTLDFAS